MGDENGFYTTYDLYRQPGLYISGLPWLKEALKSLRLGKIEDSENEIRWFIKWELKK